MSFANKIRFSPGAFRLGRPPRQREEPLTKTQAARVAALVAAMAPPKAPQKTPAKQGKVLTVREVGDLAAQFTSKFVSTERRLVRCRPDGWLAGLP